MSVNYSEQFLEALLANGGRGLLRTSLGTEALSRIPLEIRQRVFFSAGVMVADWLDEWYVLVTDLLEERVDRASARLAIKQQLQAAEYVPAKELQGSLLDLSSDRRINLILDTQRELMHGIGRFEQTNTADILQANPGRELYRAMSRAEPRDWYRKWEQAGGKFYAGRMIARADDPIWMRSLDAGGFNRFGIPTGPFDFNSGMRTKSVPYEEALQLGLISAGEAAPKPTKLPEASKELALDRRHLSQAMRDAIEAAGVGQFDEEGVLHAAPPY